MNKILTSAVTLFFLMIYSGVQAQQEKETVDFRSLITIVDTSEQPASGEVDPLSPQAQEGTRIIESKEVLVDEQGVQSLVIPAHRRELEMEKDPK
jgi:hypothetical protein